MDFDRFRSKLERCFQVRSCLGNSLRRRLLPRIIELHFGKEAIGQRKFGVTRNGSLQQRLRLEEVLMPYSVDQTESIDQRSRAQIKIVRLHVSGWRGFDNGFLLGS